MTSKVYEIVTDKIIAALESRTPLWRKLWQAGIPRNAITNRPYSGINALLLGVTPYADPRCLTFKQCSEKGGKVRKGEKSTLIVFWKQNPVKVEDDQGELTERTIPLLRYYLVFNVEQCEGLDLPTIETRTVNAIEQAEAIVAAMPNRPSIAFDGGDEAYYKPNADSIHLPHRNTFETAAEFGASFLCAHAGIENTIGNSSAYINGWLRKLKSEPKLAIVAASQGQKAADYILNTGAGE